MEIGYMSFAELCYEMIVTNQDWESGQGYSGYTKYT